MTRLSHHIARRWALWGIGCAAVLVLLAGAPAAFAAAPRTSHAAAYDLMKHYMQQWDNNGFGKATDCGSLTAYRRKLAGLRFKIDTKLKPLAKYDPKTKTLTLSKDPRKINVESGWAAWGEIVYHEVTHAFEDQHGDVGIWNSDEYAERNVEYMMFVNRKALVVLDQLERNAKAGVSVEKLRLVWGKYLLRMTQAAALTPEYPPDLELMRTWFGFRANPEAVRQLYLTNKAFSGTKWKNLRKALTPAFEPGDWAGTWDPWVGGVYYGGLTLTVSGASVTGIWEYPAIGEQFQGTLSADAGTMTGTWLVDTNLWGGPEHYVKTFDVDLANPSGSWTFLGYMQSDSDPSHRQTLFEASRR